MKPVIVIAIFFGSLVSAYAVQTANLTYAGWDTTSCNTNLGIWIQMPDGPGPFPVHIHTVGTFANYQAYEAPTILSAMAGRGYLSASIQYVSTGPYNCASVTNKS